MPDVCDGKDNNCNGIIDEGGPRYYVTYYRDADGDGYGTASDTKISNCTPPAGYVKDNTDCNDANAAINPGATEVCGNQIDDNCDGQKMLRHKHFRYH
jgi:hypothetical protein